MVANKFIESDLNLFMIAIALNGIGIMAFLLYSRNQSKVKWIKQTSYLSLKKKTNTICQKHAELK